MKTLFFKVLLLTLIVGIGCKTKQKAEANPKTNTESVASNNATNKSIKDEKPGRGKAPRYMIVQIERTRCFGKCPAYKAKIWNDGVAEYEGKANVEKIGLFTATASPELIANLQQIANKSSFIENVEKRSAQKAELAPSDLPALNLYYNNGEKESYISLKGVDAPEFNDFVTATEKALNGLKWTKNQ